MFKKLFLTLNTIKHLKLIQVLYRLRYKTNLIVKKKYNYNPPNDISPLKWNNILNKNECYLGDSKFTFLNIENDFENNIDWNYNCFGKLWTYNLNYFDFLNQKKIKNQEGLNLIYDFINKLNKSIDGLEPYPISLRGINWVKFLSKEKIINNHINKSLYNQYLKLIDNLEYHILGNHLLENGFSLLFGAYYFKNMKFYKLSTSILKKELNNQILKDGAHFELSPMYHQIILERIIDCVYLIENNDWIDDSSFLSFLKQKSTLMLGWLNEITFNDGTIPMVNDSTKDISLTTKELNYYCEKINITSSKIELGESGYRKYFNNLYELFVDVGEIGPRFQPGHAHADTFNFLLNSLNKPIIVDTGITTYNIGDIRDIERSTFSHNTVSIFKNNSSEIWGGFRVANRAHINIQNEKYNYIKASHNGFKKLGITHTRSFKCHENSIIITDDLNKIKIGQAHLHFHPNCKIKIDETKNIIKTNNLLFSFIGEIKITKSSYYFSEGFNKKINSTKAIIEFTKSLKTIISVNKV